jgi:hypothetical protein
MLQIEKLKRTPLARVAAERLMKETPHVLDRELSIGSGRIGNVFALADGRALIYAERGRSMLYPSRDELAAALRADYERIRQGYSALLDVLPQGESFAAAVPELLLEAPARLTVEDASALDFSMQSLALVDAAVRRLGRTKALSAEVFPWLVAYVGEVIRREVAQAGRWEMRLEEDGLTWGPYIVDARGNLFPVLRFYKDLLEHGPRVLSLRTFVEELTPIYAEVMTRPAAPGSVSGGGVIPPDGKIDQIREAIVASARGRTCY